MATALNKFGLRVGSSICRRSWQPPRQPRAFPTSASRSFTCARRLRADRQEVVGGSKVPDDDIQLTQLSTSEFAATLGPEDRATFDALSEQDKRAYQEEAEELRRYMMSPAVRTRLDSIAGTAAKSVERELPPEGNPPRRLKEDLLNIGDDEDPDIGEEADFDMDDITSLAHGELEQHREIREYARIAAWEMPLLSQLSKSFVLPSKDQPLRFRYTNYMGEQHPAEKKVVVEFCTQDIPDLTEAQRAKLIKVAGVRYNPETDIVKMSCEMFETQAQNKRYLGDVVDLLLKEARDNTDTFEDIPLDFRHHKFVEKPQFPKSWYMTPERKQQLEDAREQRQLLDQQKEEQGKLVEGVKEIEKVLVSSAVNSSIGVVQAQHGEKGNVKRPRLKAR